MLSIGIKEMQTQFQYDDGGPSDLRVNKSCSSFHTSSCKKASASVSNFTVTGRTADLILWALATIKETN